MEKSERIINFVDIILNHRSMNIPLRNIINEISLLLLIFVICSCNRHKEPKGFVDFDINKIDSVCYHHYFPDYSIMIHDTASINAIAQALAGSEQHNKKEIWIFPGCSSSLNIYVNGKIFSYAIRGNCLVTAGDIFYKNDDFDDCFLPFDGNYKPDSNGDVIEIPNYKTHFRIKDGYIYMLPDLTAKGLYKSLLKTNEPKYQSYENFKNKFLYDEDIIALIDSWCLKSRVNEKVLEDYKKLTFEKFLSKYCTIEGEDTFLVKNDTTVAYCLDKHSLNCIFKHDKDNKVKVRRERDNFQ